MQTTISKFLQIDDIPKNKRSIFYRYLLIRSGDVLAFGILATYLILYILDQITFLQFGIIIGIKLTVQTILDYPSGTLGDYIGQRTVMIIAFLSYIVALSTLYFADGFTGFLIGYIFFGISNSQESGALSSWLDNIYTLENSDIDPNRQIYGAFLGRVNSIHQLLLLISLILGGIISDTFGRRNVIIVSFFWVLVTLMLIITLMRPINDKQEPRQFSISSYFTSLPKGIRYIKETPGLFLFYFGLGLSISTIGNVYDELIQFPLYSAYLIRDTYVGIFQGFLLFLSIFAGLIMSKWSKSVTRERLGLIGTLLMTHFLLYVLLAIFVTIIPPPNTFDISIVIILLVIFQVGVVFNPLFGIFFRRIQIDLVPSDIRNSVYSLLPTIITFLGIGLSIVGGYILDEFNRTTGLIFVTITSLAGIGLVTVGLRQYSKYLTKM